MLTPSFESQASLPVKSRSWLNAYQRANQYFSYFPFHLIFGSWYGDVNCLFEQDDIQPGHGYIIAANHQSRIDPFMIMGAIPLRFWPNISMVHFMTANIFFKFFPLKLFLQSFGCFPVKQIDARPAGLDFSRVVLGRAESVFIFPEGRRTRPNQLPAKRGIEEIAHLEKIVVIPVRIRWTTSSLFRRKADITIGRPLDAKAMSAQDILDHIYALPLG